MKQYFDYQPFKTEDFLRDQAFRDWIKSPTPEMSAYWNGLIQTYPHLAKSFTEAKVLGQGMEVSWNTFSDEYTDQLFEKMQGSLISPTAPASWLLGRRLVAAASIIFLLSAGIGYYFFMGRNYQTEFAQTKVVTLYDGSMVTLNANSQIRLPSRFSWRKSRQVYLEGEAYFDVEKQPLNHGFKKFTVQTIRASVEVIGTHFNLYARPNKTVVSLDEGAIRLTDLKNPNSVLLKPGQVIEMEPHNKELKIVESATENSLAISDWRNNKLIFNDASMTALAQRFEDIYGVELLLQNDAFQEQKFRGELPVTDIKEAILILEIAFERKAIRDGNKIHFVIE
tara:strand:+ start:10 stop:1023 length:1014 start_codon:yes stop_codon:yes gene_type:complete